LLEQACLVFAQGAHPSSHGGHVLTHREIGPLDERGVDLPTLRGQHLLDSLEGAEHHAMAHMDQMPPAHGLDHLCIAPPGQGHPTGHGHWPLSLAPCRVDPLPVVGQERRRILLQAVRKKQGHTVGR